MRANKYDVSVYSTQVKKSTLHNYGRLPDNVKSLVDVDDCIQDGLLYLHSVLNNIGKNKVEYDPSRGKIETWIFKILESYFSKLVEANNRKRRVTVLVSLEELKVQLGGHEKVSTLIRIHEAQDKLREMHLHAAPHLIDFIADNIYFPNKAQLRVERTPVDFKLVQNPYLRPPRGLRKVPMTKAEILTARKKEFLTLAKKYNVTVNDYLLALQVERARQ